ncbi:MAG: biosynthetic arginine decarboxylase [Acidobacteria bacterium]|nr:MAG: biosynthetic arginine decarboxylase [Acidobacteriota bacterium]
MTTTTTEKPRSRSARGSWTVQRSEDLYGTNRWSNGYFTISEGGQLHCHPRGRNASPHSSSLVEVVREAELRGYDLPLLVRFGEILEHRIEEIAAAFRTAIAENSYSAGHLSVYPIKVNQQRHVVDVIRAAGGGTLCGLEAGSKPELMATLALADNDTQIICNGFKDEEYIELVTLGRKIGRSILPVVEKASELDLVLELAQRHEVAPQLGVRIKLASRGSGRWSSSAGHGSKFGLTATETVQLLQRLQNEGHPEALRLLHFHIGSQITDIRQLKAAVTEAARVYAELRRLGATGLEILDVGGGLGIDYDGSQTRFESSMNYTLQEYANDVVYHVGNVCHDSQVPEPLIITECGRAISAYHSVLLCNVVGVNSYGQHRPPEPQLTDDDPQPLHDLVETLANVTAKTVVECFHDAQAGLEEALTLFRLGYLTLEQRSLAEDLYWTILRRVDKVYRASDLSSEELDGLDRMLTDIYFCNMSVFQSIPDSWAIQQLFPIQPIDRLDEEPTRNGVLADVSCDSDGKVDRFIDLRDVRRSLPLHELDEDSERQYVLGFFLVGAYQEILGDLHNLFGDTNAVHASVDSEGRLLLDEVIPADTVREVLEYVQYDVDELAQRFRRDVERAVRSGSIDGRTSGQIIRYFESSLEGTTYLENPARED